MDSSKEQRAQLLALRDVFRMTGALHDAQRVQLQYLPRVVLSHSTASEAEIKFTPEDLTAPRYILFKVKVKGKPPSEMQARLKHLDAWVKFLLGSDFEVRVEYGGKKFVGKARPTYGRTHEDRPA